LTVTFATELDLTGYTGRAGQFIRIRAEKKKFGAAAVNVVIADGTEAVLEQGAASAEDDGITWRHAAQQDIAPDRPLWITVTAQDQAGHRTRKTLRHVTG
jgi:hypothetical protein